jgi:hypothetical protein
MEKDLPDVKTKESEQGDRLHDFSAHPEYERRLLSPDEQSLLRIADYLEQQVFDAVGLEGVYVDYREHELENEFISGHPDLLRFYPTENVSIITDRKFGWAPVDRADVNLQMRVYAVLAPTPDVYVAILQPRAAAADRLTIAKYNADSKAAASNQIKAILARCEAPDAPLVAGEEQCRYCRARAICPALREAVEEQLVVFDDLNRDLSKPAKVGRIEARLAQATDKQLGDLFRACALARLVNDPLGDEIRRRIADGQMEGYSLSKEVEVRKIANARRAISLLVLRGLLTRDQVLELCELGIGRVEDKYMEVNKAKAKEATTEINSALESVIEIDTRKARILRK